MGNILDMTQHHLHIIPRWNTEPECNYDGTSDKTKLISVLFKKKQDHILKKYQFLDRQKKNWIFSELKKTKGITKWALITSCLKVN